ncbi:hypothetical protein FNV43_RR00718 [Rhamnella rubrinervis]|uniref:Uncharacterized protein n=1 Tax=Rhamnella rubrinervis TaxID=2594499 RepID=A0A8K0HQX5_9ROSA|nr:hypothetical protein FNV43_RR00718 [Rhamnella rubrinervis]
MWEGTRFDGGFRLLVGLVVGGSFRHFAVFLSVPDRDHKNHCENGYNDGRHGVYSVCEVDIINTEQQAGEELKKEVKTMLAAAKTPSKKLELIDSIQRFGLSYHFESEIDEMLKQLQELINLDEYFIDGSHNHIVNLHTISLWFRLLRQGGYNISSDIFHKFTNKEGKFKEELVNDVEGMLSLYEAAHWRVQGEHILEEALSFTTTQLASSAAASTIVNPVLAEQVKHSLRQPMRMGLPRIEARHYISIYHAPASLSDDQILLTFAKLDFNILQKMHQKELSDISRWWKDLDFASKLPFARDRVVECYFWILGVYFEPQYALARRIVTKVMAVTSVIDDIYDVYATFDELKLMDGVVDHKEHNKGHGDSASSVECYMNKHGVSEEEACDELRKQVVDAWKDINEECVEPRDVPMALLMRPVNLARVMDVFYKDGDGYTHAAGPMKTFISSLLVHPIPI